MAISFEQARGEVTADLVPLGPVAVDLERASGRVLAGDLVARVDHPPHDTCAMDGYALAADGAAGHTTFRVAGESRAGTPLDRALAQGEAAVVSTGAIVPAGADTVVRWEDASLDGDRLDPGPVRPGANVRRCGEDIAAGDVLLTAGTRLRPHHIAAAVAAGLREASCRPRPRVALLTTGSELVPPGSPLRPGQLHDSNGPMLISAIDAAAAELAGRARVPDDPGETDRVLTGLLDGCDLLVVSGGVSAGRHDHVRAALARAGVEQRFWGVAIRPGAPTWFGHRGRVPVLALPGNPIALLVGWAVFGAPIVRALAGVPEPERVWAPLSEAFDRPRPRTLLVGARRGTAGIALNRSVQSHRLGGFTGCDHVAMLDPGQDALAAGTKVEIVPLP